MATQLKTTTPTWLVVLLVVVLGLAPAGFSQSVPYPPPPDKKYPVRVQIISSSGQEVTRIVGVGPTPGRIECSAQTYGNTTTVDCKTYPGSPGGSYEEVSRVLVNATVSIDGSAPGPWILCNANWAFSNCVPLPPGYYWARWKDKEHKKLRIRVLFQGDKKPKEVAFDVI